MGEVTITRIKSIYGDLRGLLEEISNETSAVISSILVKGFNGAINDLSSVSGTDYSQYKITEEARAPSTASQLYYRANIVKAQIRRVTNRLEQEYNLGSKNADGSSPNIVIFNKNHNEVSVQIDYSISDLISKSENDEEKEKLRELKEELEQPNKSWDKIKSILIWTLNFSKEAFLKILPIIIQSKIQ